MVPGYNSYKPPGDCPVCGYHTDSPSFANQGNDYIYTCQRCGTFTIGRMAIRKLAPEAPTFLLSAWIRQQNELKQEYPRISGENLNTILTNLPELTPPEKQTAFLRAIARRSPHPGFAVTQITPSVDFSLAWAAHENELLYHIDALMERGLLKWGANWTDGIHDSGNRSISGHGLVITTEGWVFLEQAKIDPSFSDQVFVAMSFDTSLTPVWEHGIKPAIEDAGYRPYRVDKDHHVDRIDAKIINEITNSIAVVADVTQQKQGVYYEAGFAEGLGRKVFWSVNKDDLKKVHFDTRQFRHVVWATPEELRAQLYELLCAVLGKRAKK